MRASVLTATVLLAAALAAGCARDGAGAGLGFSGSTMGTGYRVVVAGSPRAAIEQIEADVRTRLDELDGRLSTYIATSDVARFNAQPSTDWFEVTADTLAVVDEALDVSFTTRGAFDITVGPLVNLWGFGPDARPEHIPDAETIDRLLETTGYAFVETRPAPRAIRRTREGVRIDLSAIAKGYAVDQIAELLDGLGVIDYMVDIGGEIRTRGSSADGDPWRIAVEDPVAASNQAPAVLELKNAAVATSGDYRNYFELDGKRYSHTIDPSTGWPADNGLSSVTVVGGRASEADALATAIMVLGPDRGLALIDDEALAAMLQIRHGTEIEVVRSASFDRFLAPAD